MYDIIILGAGPAGCSAATYTARAGKKTIVFDYKGYGGQIINASTVENYPAIKEISGFDLATNFYEQAKHFGAEFKMEKVIDLQDNIDHKKVITEKGEYLTKSVIIATGSAYKNLEIEKEKELTGRGICYCATCDGALFKDKEVAVVGGGNTALTDALYLANICKKVYLIHRRDEFKGTPLYVEKLKKLSNVEFILNSNVTKLIGENQLEKIEINNEKEIEVSALFVAIGSNPDISSFRNLIALDKDGYVKSNKTKTNINNIYVAGDVKSGAIRQVATAAADGVTAAIQACEDLDNIEYEVGF